MLHEIWQVLVGIFAGEGASQWARAVAILVIGLLGGRVLARALGRLAQKKWNAEQAALVRRLMFYTTALIVLAWSLQELGFSLGVLLGAAGVASVAIGFASQTSLSNAISGFLLFGERPFRVGDVIEVEGATGEVLAVDLMSTKLRTFSNQYVRIPNEVMIKSKVTNLTRFLIRRLDLSIPVAYGEDLDRVRTLLLQVAELNDLCLSEPAPILYYTEYADSYVRLQFSAWCETRDWIKFLQSLPHDLLQALRSSGIRPPYPHRVVLESAAG
jgi:small-conductance mechanosensitive channel